MTLIGFHQAREPIAGRCEGVMHKRDYLDFDLEIERETQGYRVEVDSPAGQSTSTFMLPFSDLEFENFLLKIGHIRRGMRRIDSPEVAAVKTFGAQLFEAVFVDELRACLRSSLEEAAEQGAGLRIRLRLNDTPELAEIPWEYLYHPTLNRFLALSAETPLVRYLELPTRVRQLAVTPPLRMLAMISSPRGCPPLDVEREWIKLQKALGDLIERGLVILERIPATLAALQQQLRRAEYHILHFVGHGTFDERTQDGALLLEDADQERDMVSAQDLGTLLHDHRTLRFVMLNACEGGRASRTDPFAGTAQSLVQQGIPAVIAMQFEVSDEAAIMLAHEFYNTVADGYPVDAALAEARKALFAAGSRVEWGTPVLYLRAPDGKIFDVARADTAADPATAAKTLSQADQGRRIPVAADVPAPPPAPSRASTPELVARRDAARPAHVVDSSQAITAAAMARPALQKVSTDRNRQRMLEKVRQFWIHGILDQSIDDTAYIQLGLTYHTAAVDNPWQDMIQPPAQRATAVAPSTSIAGIYDALGGALLILGAAGVGKTTMMLELAHTLIARAEQDPTLAMPVVFNLSSWAVRRRPLDEWLVDELSARYQVPRRIGQAWVEADQVLPLFDGLDEVALEYRRACVAALNQFRSAHWLLDFVVCSREADYAALSAKLQVQAAVVVQPLTAAQVDAYLAQAGDQLAAVQTLLHEDAALRELADTPLMLSIMVLAYRGMPIDALRARGSLDERRAHVFDTYIQRMLARRGVATRYAPQQTLGWLAWLASNMVQRSQTIFFIEGLQPNWMHKSEYLRYYPIGVGLIVGLVVGLATGVSLGLSYGVFDPREGFVYGIAGGICAAFIFGIVVQQAMSNTVIHHKNQWSIWKALERGAFMGLIIGTAEGLIGGLIDRLSIEPSMGVLTSVVAGITSGITFGLISGLMVGLIVNLKGISIIETLRWSWTMAKEGLSKKVIRGLVAGLIIGSVNTIAGTLQAGARIGIANGLAVGLVVGLSTILVTGLVSGMMADEVEARTVPNQGIWQSAHNALFLGGAAAFIVGMITSLIYWLLRVPFDLHYGLAFELAAAMTAGLITGLAVGLIYGGLSSIQHFVLRLLLWHSRVMPWKCDRFLDYAAERLLLRKVGGGYIFIHRLLLEHFAGRAIAPSDQAGATLVAAPMAEDRHV
jgi:eukaryotic-like serine/threonine-protein kinase